MEHWGFDGKEWILKAAAPPSFSCVGSRKQGIYLKYPLRYKSSTPPPPAPSPGDMVVYTITSRGWVLEYFQNAIPMRAVRAYDEPEFTVTVGRQAAPSNYPHTCQCGSPCLKLFVSQECSNSNCKFFKEMKR